MSQTQHATAAALRMREVVQRFSLTPRTLRHYEAVGLVRPDRNHRGWRVYSDEAQQHLAWIVTLRTAGLGLPEIRVILRRRSAADARADARQRLRRLETECLTRLGSVRAALSGLDSLPVRLPV